MSLEKCSALPRLPCFNTIWDSSTWPIRQLAPCSPIMISSLCTGYRRTYLDITEHTKIILKGTCKYLRTRTHKHFLVMSMRSFPLLCEVSLQSTVNCQYGSTAPETTDYYVEYITIAIFGSLCSIVDHLQYWHGPVGTWHVLQQPRQETNTGRFIHV